MYLDYQYGYRVIVFENRIMCISIPSLFRSFCQICDIVLGFRNGRDAISHEKYNEDPAAHGMSEAVRESAPTFIDISRDLQSGELAKDESLIISGMLVGCVLHLRCLVLLLSGKDFGREEEMV